MAGPTTVAITGASGLIGGALADALVADGHRVVRVTRDAARQDDPDYVVWDPDRGTIQTEPLDGVDAVVHLAGEPLGSSRWTDDTKRRIRESRVRGTSLLAETLAGLASPPEVLVSGSAVGVYGSRGAQTLTEEATLGDDFLAEVCRAWEDAAGPAATAGIRVVHPRTGVVIAKDGPLIDKIELPFKLGVGGRVGSGGQYVPWISLVDQVRALRFLIDEPLSGPVNLCAPAPVTNAELTRELGRVLRRPTVLPIPVLAVRALYGEMGETLATSSQRAVPHRLLDAGFVFTHPDLGTALRIALRGEA